MFFAGGIHVLVQALRGLLSFDCYLLQVSQGSFESLLAEVVVFNRLLKI